MSQGRASSHCCMQACQGHDAKVVPGHVSKGGRFSDDSAGSCKCSISPAVQGTILLVECSVERPRKNEEVVGWVV